MATFQVSDESVNSYGFRVLTAGIDTTQFERNPVLLFNHQGEWDDANYCGPLGRWENLKKDTKGELFPMVADAIFDLNDPKAVLVAGKVDGKFINAASIGLRPIEWSEDPALMLPGQTRPTVTKCKLLEISVVDFPANENALVLFDDEGKKVNLSDPKELDRITLSALHKPEPKIEPMKLKLISALVALSAFFGVTFEKDETEKEFEVTPEKLKSLNDQLTELVTLKSKVNELESENLTLKTATDTSASEITTLKAQVSEKDTTIAELNQLLGGQPTALTTEATAEGGANGSDVDPELKAYYDEVNLKYGLK